MNLVSLANDGMAPPFRLSFDVKKEEILSGTCEMSIQNIFLYNLSWLMIKGIVFRSNQTLKMRKRILLKK